MSAPLRRGAIRSSADLDIRAKAVTPAANGATRDARARQYTYPPSSPATPRRSLANAPQRAGAARWTVAMGAPV